MRADGEAQRGHHPGSGSGVDGGVVLTVDGVAQPVQRLDAPVLADEGGHLFGGGAGVGQAGHAEGGDRGARGAGGVGDVTFDQPDLVDVRERQVGRGGQYADGAGGDPAVAGVDVAVGDRGVGPGQRVEGGVEAGLVLFDGQDELCADRVQVLGVGALRPGSGDVLLLKNNL